MCNLQKGTDFPGHGEGRFEMLNFSAFERATACLLCITLSCNEPCPEDTVSAPRGTGHRSKTDSRTHIQGQMTRRIHVHRHTTRRIQVELDTYTDRGPGGYRWNWTHTQTEDREDTGGTGHIHRQRTGERGHSRNQRTQAWCGKVTLDREESGEDMDCVDSSMRRRLAQRPLSSIDEH